MADPARARKIADRIQVIVAEMLERRIKDPRLGFVTITDVRVTGDTQQASIFYTVFGGDEERAEHRRGARVGQGHAALRGRQAARHAADAVAGVRPRRAARDRRATSTTLLARGQGARRGGRRGRQRRRRTPARPTRTRSRRRAERRATSDELRGPTPVDAPAEAARTDDAPTGPSPTGCSSSTSRPAGPRTTSSPGSAGWPAPARSATPARSTRWRPACWCSASTGPPGCSASSSADRQGVRRDDPARASHHHRRRRGRGHRGVRRRRR